MTNLKNKWRMKWMGVIVESKLTPKSFGRTNALAACIVEADAEIIRIEAINADLLEACKLTAAIVIDKYDACDKPLNDAWNASVEAIRSLEEQS